jgi:hypothetical protein
MGTPWLGSFDVRGISVPLHIAGVDTSQTELGVFLLVGLLGGAHCLGMCGPLVTVYADRIRSERETESGPAVGTTTGQRLTTYEVRQHALFNLGRTASYALLGGFFGLVGSVLFDLSALVGTVDTLVRAVSGIVVGLFVVAVGVRYALGRQGTHSVLGSERLGRAFQWVSARVGGRATDRGIVGLGLVHGILPCPLLYPAFLYAFARGSPLGGAAALGVLGLGTFPTLFLYGTIIQSVDVTHRQRLHRLLGVAFLLMGWMALSHGLGLLGVEVPHLEVPIYQPLRS